MGPRYTITVGAADVGRRVSVRWRIPAPAGEPSVTDAVGTLEAWTDTEVRIRRRDGSMARVARADVLAAKTLPPSPPRRGRG